MQGNSGVVTQAEIAKMFGVSDRQARNYLSLLLNDGKICAVGANKKRTYTLVVRYQPTHHREITERRARNKYEH